MKRTRFDPSDPFKARASEWIGDMTVWIRQNAPDNSEQYERLKRNLRKAFKEDLTSRQRQIMEMYYFQELSIDAIANELRIDRSTVSRTLKRGRERLRRCLNYSL